MNARLRKFLSFYHPYRKILAADIACAVLSAAIALIIPLVIRHITGVVLPGDASAIPERLLSAGALMVTLVALQAGCVYVYDYQGHAMGAKMERDMRAELFAHYQRLPFRFYDDQRPGALMSRLTNDLNTLAELYHHGPEDLVVYLTKVAGALVILLSINPPLALATLAFLPPMAFFAVRYGKKLNVVFQKNLQIISDVNAQVEENLSGIRVVKAFANEGLEREKFRTANERFLRGRVSIYKNEAVFYGALDAATHLMAVTVVAVGGLAISRTTLSLSDLIAFLLYVNFLVEPIPRLAFIMKQYQEGIAGFHRFMDMLDEPPEAEEAGNAFARPKGEVAFVNVGFRYREGGPDVLKGVTLRVAAGEFVAIVGDSGVGKTTLCSLIPRFYDACEGRVLIDGTDARDWPLPALRRGVGVVQQDTYLFSGTVMENILYGRPEANPDEAIEAARKADAHDFIMALPGGYEAQIGHRGIKLSGGQRQRLSIARAFLKDPPILILDEATSALDGDSERAVQASLKGLSRDRTTFVIAHRLSTVRAADRIVVLSEQGVAESGTHEQLMALGGAYAKMCGS